MSYCSICGKNGWVYNMLDPDGDIKNVCRNCAIKLEDKSEYD